MKVKYVSLICWLVIVHQAFATPERIPPDVFKAQEDGYLYADYPGVFDDIDGGITIEAWIYWTEAPEDREADLDRDGNWLIFGKPGSYFVNISGRNLADSLERDLPEGSSMIRYGIETQPDGNSWGYSSFGHGVPHRSDLQRWIHIVLQISAEKDGIHRMVFYDQRWPGGRSNPRIMGRMNSPLMIRGANPKSTYGGWKRFESMKGYIDEVRISKGAAYGDKIDAEIRPRRRLRLDVQTIALWHFKEGPSSHIYQDSSGNGYTLFAGGSLATADDPRDRLATTWGSLKKRAQEIR